MQNTVDKFKTRAIAFDCETHLVQPGLLVPPMVCGSFAWMMTDGTIDSVLRLPSDVVDVFRGFADRKDDIFVGANIAYDMAVLAVEAAKSEIDLLPLIYRLYEDGRVFDVQIAEMLNAIAAGNLGIDPRDGSDTRYSLDYCVSAVLGRDDAKKNAFWRLRYALLEGVPIEEWPEDARQYPIDDAVNTLEVAIKQVEHNENLHDLSNQCYAAFVAHLGAVWGFPVDGNAVVALEDRVTKAREQNTARFVREGILKLDGKVNTAELKRRTTIAFGSRAACKTCNGSGKTAGKSKKLIGCKVCSSTGLESGDGVPRTAKDGVQTSRDALTESGDETLIDFAHFSEENKILKTYLPFLKKGVGHPINLKPQIIKETGRMSYSDVIHQLPRNGGVRECLVARPGMVLCSCDYSGIELVTHAQSCLWIKEVGESELANALNAGVKVHDKLGAEMAGVSYDEFLTRKDLKPYRQAAKAGNFGFPGFMVAIKLVIQQRKIGPDTVKNGRTYKGLRFCLLTGGEDVCGHTKVTTWGTDFATKKDRKLPGPICKRCIECAIELREAWFKTWPENVKYFEFVKSIAASGGPIVQHVSKRIRALPIDKKDEPSVASIANGYFQGLASDGFKAAMRAVSKEMYTDRGSALYGSRAILFTHDEIVAELPESQMHDAAMRLSEVMVREMRRYTPDVKVSAEPALMRRMYKGAEPVYQNGKLVPWEPV
jgi:hypothetical protein